MLLSEEKNTKEHHATNFLMNILKSFLQNVYPFFRPQWQDERFWGGTAAGDGMKWFAGESFPPAPYKLFLIAIQLPLNYCNATARSPPPTS